jgi:hypothetical protein
VTLVNTSVYYEQLVPFPAGGTGTISMSSAIIGQPYLLQGNVTGIGIYAIPGTTVGAFQFDITKRQFSIDLRSSFDGLSGYLRDSHNNDFDLDV